MCLLLNRSCGHSSVTCFSKFEKPGWSFLPTSACYPCRSDCRFTRGCPLAQSVKLVRNQFPSPLFLLETLASGHPRLYTLGPPRCSEKVLIRRLLDTEFGVSHVVSLLYLLLQLIIILLPKHRHTISFYFHFIINPLAWTKSFSPDSHFADTLLPANSLIISKKYF